MEKGILYIVSTPIGNLKDITYRAVEILNEVDLVAVEDTRRASILFKEYQIMTKRISFYKDIIEKRSVELVERLKSGENIALISDAGTPAVSDPGYRLIVKAIDNDITIVPIPGASSILSAFVAAGLPTDSFVFEGFLPKKKGRKTKFEKLQEEPRTIILFESPYRVLKTLKQLLEYFGDRRCVSARELTKKFEEFKRGKISDLIQHFSRVKPKGEFVLVVEGNRKKRKK